VLSFEVPEKEQISGTTRTVLYYYVVPARLDGRWEISVPKSLFAAPFALSVKQDPETLTGFARIGSEMHPLRDFVVNGRAVRFGLFAQGKLMTFVGEAKDDEISGFVELHSGGRENWSARRSGS
jgi:hypothetical protein